MAKTNPNKRKKERKLKKGKINRKREQNDKNCQKKNEKVFVLPNCHFQKLFKFAKIYQKMKC
jgi:hypothetical protein